MSSPPSGSMFDYDARPVTPQVVIVGLRASSVGYQLRDFLSRNGVPYDWVEFDDTERVRGLLDLSDVVPYRLPICLLPEGSQLASATVIGGQKIVPDLTTALRRIQQYCLPLEDRRAPEAYRVPSGVNNILVINRVITPGRITALLVRESLGF